MIGGYLVPETCEVDVKRPGRLFTAVRSIGDAVIELGLRIRQLGYSKKTIHPLKSLHEYFKDIEAQRKGNG